MQTRLRATWKLPLVCATSALLLACAGRHDAAGVCNLVAELDFDNETILLGQPMQLSVAVANVGTSNCVVTAEINFGQAPIQALQGSCVYPMPALLHLSIPAPDLTTRRHVQSSRRLVVRPGAQIDFGALTINGRGSGLLLEVPRPGEYEVQIEIEASVFSDLRNSPTQRRLSSSAPIRFAPPERGETELALGRLRSCVSSEDCTDLDTAEYFELVVDPEAADLLLQLLEINPSHYIFAARALVHQGRFSDIKRLWALAEQLGANSALGANYKTLAIELEDRINSECW